MNKHLWLVTPYRQYALLVNALLTIINQAHEINKITHQSTIMLTDGKTTIALIDIDPWLCLH